MKSPIIIPLAFIAFIFCSFKSPTDNITTAVGVYGVKGCSDNNAYLIKLSINEDHTFHYYNASDPDQKVDVEGKWNMINDKIIFTDYGSEVSIHDKWKLDDNFKCIKSRKGLNFTRICEIE